LKRTIQITLILSAVTAFVTIGVQQYRKAARPNLLRNASFDSPMDTVENWHRISILDTSGLCIESDGQRNYALIDTIHSLNEDRNPYTDQIFAQKYKFTGGSSRTMTLRGSAFKETADGMAVVMLKLADRNNKFVRNVYRCEDEPGKWVDFEISATAKSALDMVEVILGLNGSGRVRFDDLDLVSGDRRGLELATGLFLGVVILVCLAAGLAILEILPRRLLAG